MSKPKPLSLNERNDRLLGDLSSHSRSLKSQPSLHPPPKEEKPTKVKLEGRRRLCKISSETPPDPSDDLVDSPIPQIRDILNDLSSHLESLSMEKRKVTKTPMSSFALLSDSDSADSSSLNAPTATETELPENNGKGKAISPVHLNSVLEDEEDEEEKEDSFVLSGKASDKEVPIMRSDGNTICIDDAEDEVDDLVAEDEHTVKLTNGSSTYILPGEIAKMLYPHQREGLDWLWALHCKQSGGILGDDMGLGKTMQVKI